MKKKIISIALAALTTSLFAADTKKLEQQLKQLQQQTYLLQTQLNALQKQLAHQENTPKTQKKSVAKSVAKPVLVKESNEKESKAEKEHRRLTTFESAHHHNVPEVPHHTSNISVHTPDKHPAAKGYYPTALIADERIITYIAGTPVVTSPYLGDRPAFDGSDYIVNISSINRDIRLMQQRRRLYEAYEKIGYPIPNVPIIAISGKTEPIAVFRRPYLGDSTGDLNLGANELDVAAALNEYVEAFTSLSYDDSPSTVNAQRVRKSVFTLNMGFVNIGDLDKSPFYFTAGQLYAPFGRYSSSMISSPITLGLARTKTRPFIFGYKSQTPEGPYAAAYGFISDTTLGHSGVGGINIGYTINHGNVSGDIGAGMIGSLDDSQGMQDTGSTPGTTFGGFGSPTNGSEMVGKIPGVNVHGNLSFDRYSLTAEWVGVSRAFSPQDLSFNGHGAKPQALQLEGAVTFFAFNKPASLAAGYQWSRDTLALNLPEQRMSGVFNISLWKDTVESLEYRHDIDFNSNSFANGAAPPGVVNTNTVGTGKAADTLIAQIGVYF